MYNIYKTAQYQTKWKYRLSSNSKPVLEHWPFRSPSRPSSVLYRLSTPIVWPASSSHSPTHDSPQYTGSTAAESVVRWPGRLRGLRPCSKFSRPWHVRRCSWCWWRRPVAAAVHHHQTPRSIRPCDIHKQKTWLVFTEHKVTVTKAGYASPKVTDSHLIHSSLNKQSAT